MREKSRRRWRWGAGLAASLCLGGCGHGRMMPAQDARVLPDAPGFAAIERNGLRIAASGDDWSAKPADLADVLTPVRVRIVNHSGHAVRLLYDRFSLVGAHGRVYRPLPPVPFLHEHPQDSAATVRPYFASASFFVRAAYGDMYPSLPPWPAHLSTDESFYQRQYARWSADLPTREMQRRGLPEGVLADGGQVSGFLYFEDATRREGKLAFTAELDDGDTDAKVAAISIPFRVE